MPLEVCFSLSMVDCRTCVKSHWMLFTADVALLMVSTIFFDCSGVAGLRDWAEPPNHNAININNIVNFLIFIVIFIVFHRIIVSSHHLLGLATLTPG